MSDTDTVLHDTSSSSVGSFTTMGQELEEDREYFNGESLSVGFERSFGFSWNDRLIKEEINILSRDQYKKVLDLINQMKCYHFNGLIQEFEISEFRLKQVQRILVRRELLKPIPWEGKAKRTHGMIIVCTRDCKEEDIRKYLIEYVAMDELRLKKEVQRNGKKKGHDPADTVVTHNEKVRKRTREIREKEEKLESLLADQNCEIPPDFKYGSQVQRQKWLRHLPRCEVHS